jgi:hypothetical protein
LRCYGLLLLRFAELLDALTVKKSIKTVFVGIDSSSKLPNLYLLIPHDLHEFNDNLG